MAAEGDVPVSRWSGVQRRVRRLAPRSVQRADLQTFRLVARTEIPIVGPLLPRLSQAANHSRLWLVLAALIAAAGDRSARRAALRGVVSIAGASALVNVPAKLLAGRQRPDVSVVPAVRQLARVPMSTSFPSGHSASAFAFATAMSMEEPRVRVPLFTLAGAVALSRVYTGVHYPGDVLVGSLAGVAVARATTRLWALPDRRVASVAAAEVPGPAPDPDGTGLVVVDNVASGSPLGTTVTARLREALPKASIIRCDPGEAFVPALQRAAREARVLGVAGGDGSVNAAAAVAHEHGIPLAIVPDGTFNNLANDLGIHDVEATIRAVREGRCVAIDMGEIDGQLFVNTARIGLYPDFVAERERLEDRIGKWPAAAASMARLLWRRRPYEVEIAGRRRRIWMLFIGNGTYETAGAAPRERRHLDDGHLDIRMVVAEHPWSRTRAWWGTVTGRTERAVPYERWRADEVTVRTLDDHVDLACDGEHRPAPSTFTVRKRPRALRIMLSRDGDADRPPTSRPGPRLPRVRRR